MQRMFDYDDCANRETLAALGASNSVRARQLLAHIIGTQWLWLARLTGGQPRMDVWPELSLHEMDEALEALRAPWRALLAQPHDGAIRYTNSKGEAWESRVEDVLTHVVFHGAYHRGQIAMVMRGEGEHPPYTDFIHATRTRAV